MVSSVRCLFLSALVAALPAGGAAQDRTQAPPPNISAGESGLTVQSASGDFELRFGLLVNADGRFAPGDDAASSVDTFVLRRLRIPLRGRVARRFEFYVNPDFGNGTVVVQDAYLDTVFSASFRVRVGKTKTPFGLERLQSSPHTLFFERALPSALAPNRDVGVQVIGEFANGLLSYQAGVLNGVADGASGDADTADGKDVAGRVLVRPFRSRAASGPLGGLTIGVAGTVGKQSGTAALPTLRTPLLQQTILAYSGAAAAGTRTRFSPQASYVFKSFSAFAEYVRTEMPVASSVAREDVAHQAWQIAGSYVLTGEAATDGSAGVRPGASFDPEHGRWGAVQIAARYHRLEVGDAARRFAAAGGALIAEAWTAGVNWYLTPNIRYIVNAERTVFDGGASRARPAEQALVFRAQLNF